MPEGILCNKQTVDTEEQLQALTDELAAQL